MRCAACRGGVDGEAWACCAGCGVALHAGCWRQVERCPTAGCAAPFRVDDRRADHVVPAPAPPIGVARPVDPRATAARLAVSAQARAGEVRCVYCRDDVRDEAPWACPGCGVALHAECRRQVERCPTIGCARPHAVLPVEGEAPAGSPVRVVDRRADHTLRATAPATAPSLAARLLVHGIIGAFLLLPVAALLLTIRGLGDPPLQAVLGAVVLIVTTLGWVGFARWVLGPRPAIPEPRAEPRRARREPGRPTPPWRVEGSYDDDDEPATAPTTPRVDPTPDPPPPWRVEPPREPPRSYDDEPAPPWTARRVDPEDDERPRAPWRVDDV